MATTKTSSAPKTKRPKTPAPKTYTIKRLVKRWERWEYDEEDIKGFIEDGHLKQAFDTVRLDANLSSPFFRLRDIHFYKHHVESGELLKIEQQSTLEELVDSVTENDLIPCSKIKFLYLPKDVSAKSIGKRGEDCDWIHFFYDVNGNQLIPTHNRNIESMLSGKTEYHINSLPIDKHLFEELLIIPLEEVERFENENDGKNKRPYKITLRELRMKQAQKLSNFDPEKHRKASQAQKKINKGNMRKAYFELFAKEVRIYEEQKNLPKRSFAEIRDELESDKTHQNNFNNKFQEMYGQPSMKEERKKKPPNK